MEVFAPLTLTLRPGIDLETIMKAEEGEALVWKEWLYDSASSLADDLFAYHIGQGRLGGEVSRYVFERHESVGERIPVPRLSIESLPIRAMFKDPGQPSTVTWK